MLYSVAPFNSMKERENFGPNENPGKHELRKLTLSDDLGPGTYATENVKVVATVKDMMSNSFTTKVS